MKPDARAWMNNLRGPMPWREKLSLYGRNQWRKVSTRSNCCGHPGEPGC